MANNEHEPRRPVEDMLRRWGAHQAVRNTVVGPVPVVRREGLRTLGRWMPLAAAILLAAGLATVWATLGSRGDQQADDARHLQAQLDESKKNLQQSWAMWQQSQAQLRQQSTRAELAEDKLRKLQAELATKSPADFRKEIDDLNSELTRLARTIRQHELAAKQQAELIDKLKQDLVVASRPSETTGQDTSQELASMRKELNTANKQVKVLQATAQAAAEEVARVQKMADDSAKDFQKAQDELATVKTRQAQYFAQMQAAYLSAAAPAEERLRARQTACKRSRMVQRTMALRRESRNETLSQLLDRLEVVLTRLEMLRAYDRRSAEGFARLLESGALVSRIDDMLASDLTWTKARDYLTEAKLILTGAEHVG